MSNLHLPRSLLSRPLVLIKHICGLKLLRVITPYLVFGCITLSWAFLIWQTKFPAIQSEHENSKEDHGRFSELFRYPHFLLAVVAQFFYVGAQVGTWSYFIQCRTIPTST